MRGGVAWILFPSDLPPKSMAYRWLPAWGAAGPRRLPPGWQLQVAFGERRVDTAGIAIKPFFYAATRGFSPHLHVRAMGTSSRRAGFPRDERATHVFGGIAREALPNNARALVLIYDPSRREAVLHVMLHAFAKHWGSASRTVRRIRHARARGRPCKGNAIAGRRFPSWGVIEAHLAGWKRHTANASRWHDQRGMDRSLPSREAGVLRAAKGIPPSTTDRDLMRSVGADGAMKIDGNAYSMPWRLSDDRPRGDGGAQNRWGSSLCELQSREFLAASECHRIPSVTYHKLMLRAPGLVCCAPMSECTSVMGVLIDAGSNSADPSRRKRC